MVPSLHKVKTTPYRPTNKEFRDTLTGALVIPGLTKEDLETKGNLVWWEKETFKDESPMWRE